jgi:opacity protein-like surface antigen
MKRIARSLLALSTCGALWLAVGGTARAQAQRFYFNADLGGNWMPKTDLKEFFGPVPSGSQVEFDPGVRAGAAVGFNFTDWFATEAQLGLYANEIKSISHADVVHDATLVNVPLFLNAKLQYANRSRCTPYAGVGAGFTTSILDADYLQVNRITFSGSDADAVFAWQAFGGLRFSLNERMSLGVEYRYFNTDSPRWSGDTFYGGPFLSDSLRIGRVQTHSVSVMFQVHF